MVKNNLVEGPVGNGQVKDEKLTVNFPNNKEIESSSMITPESKSDLDLLAETGITYKELVFTLGSSVVLHESSHGILDSGIGSQLEKDFSEITGISNDIEGHTLSFLEEGIVYAYQMLSDEGDEVYNKLDGKKPQGEEGYTVAMRKRLAKALRTKVEDYINQGKQIDGNFIKFAGEEMKKLDIQRYVEEADGVDNMISKYNGLKKTEVDGFVFVEVNNPLGFLEEIAKGGDYLFSGSSRRVNGELDPSSSVSKLPAIYMTRNPVLAMFHGFVGGMDNKIFRENTITMQIDDDTGEITYPVAEFSVGNPEAIAEEGYIYIIKNSLKYTRNENGEYLSSDSVKPDLVLKFKKSNFPFEIKTSQERSTVI